jgi:hypothetical protein
MVVTKLSPVRIDENPTVKTPKTARETLVPVRSLTGDVESPTGVGRAAAGKERGDYDTCPEDEEPPGKFPIDKSRAYLQPLQTI